MQVAKTGSTGETLNEAKKINASLSTLCMVISALSEGKPHIPYRNSKLTRILQARMAYIDQVFGIEMDRCAQESLGGNSKTMILIACSPSPDNAGETHGSLRFAMRAKKVKNAAVVNRVLSVEELTRANSALRLELQAKPCQSAPSFSNSHLTPSAKISP